jgi:hypothetical protein
MFGKKKVLRAPKCDCECKRCNNGEHCGRHPECDHPTWEELWKPKLTRVDER